MSLLEGYIVIGTYKDVKYYFLSTIEKWTPDFKKISLGDINESKIEVDMKDYPLMDPKYSHEKITINGGTYYD